MSTAERRIYNVTEITRLIRGALEGTFGDVWVEGELSNVRRPASGHYYFTVKDESAQISGVLFRGNQRELTFTPADGLLVRIFGQLTVYERGGQYQVIVRKVEEAGKGSLQARFEELKKRLHAEGLFDPARKKPLPLLPQHVGVVTSPTGAAIQDILNVVSRRFPNLHLVVAPARVQGQGAAEEIAAAIDLLNRRGGLDAMIIGRGGGSLEDLWCFNEEIVARAIARSEVPVISAVGHEIDFTISDFAADLRAPTPSAGAELVVGRKDRFVETLAAFSNALGRALRETALRYRNRVQAAGGSYVFREPANMVRQHRQRLDAIVLRMEHQLRSGLQEGRQRLADTGLRSGHALRVRSAGVRQQLDDSRSRQLHALTLRRESARQDVRRLEGQLRALSPIAVLERGYSITSDASGGVLRSAGGVSAGDTLTTRLADGTVTSTVADKKS
jgi:exodeoxyribonuclease VII large subunit